MSAKENDTWNDLKTFVLILGTSAVVVGAVWGFYMALKMLFA